MDKKQEKLEALMNELSNLEEQLKTEEEKLSNDKKNKSKIIDYELELENSRERLSIGETEKNKMKEKINFYLNIDNISVKIFWCVLLFGSVVSFSSLFFSGVFTMLVGYAITMFLTMLIGASSLKAEKKYIQLVEQLEMHENSLEIERISSKTFETQIAMLSSSIMSEMQKKLVEMNIGNIKENIIYIEEIIWNELSKSNLSGENKYISELENTFYPKLFMPKTENKKLIKNW